jgi:hypothetical protein
MKRIPRFIRDLISTRTTMKTLLGQDEAAARKAAVAEVLRETGYKATKKPNKPSPASTQHHHRRSSTGLTIRDARDFIADMMRDVVGHRPSSSSSSIPSSSSDRRSPAGHHPVRRARQAVPPVDEEPPTPKHHTELLYTSGGLSGGLRSGAVNLNHEFRDDATTARWRLDQTRQWK